MRKYIEVFEYEVPDDVEDFPTVEDYIMNANMATCPFYDDYDCVPEVKRTKFKFTIKDEKL